MTDAATGGEVSQLQHFLTDYFNLDEDIVSGYFGPVTEQYVRVFQTNNSIEAAGSVGPKTRALISSLCREL